MITYLLVRGGTGRYYVGSDALSGWVEGCYEPLAVPTPSRGSLYLQTFLGEVLEASFLVAGITNLVKDQLLVF